MCYFSCIHVDANSVNVTPPQDTPISHRKDGKFINFGIDVEIQKPIEKLPRGTDSDFCVLRISLYSPISQYPRENEG